MGMINYETILSAYDDKLTLMQWLKKVEKALTEAAATSFKVNKKGEATVSFSIVFEDGSEIESGDIVLQQGESVAAGRIENGHLILTLTNGDELDAGNLFNGNVDIVGDVSITGDLSAENITGDSIIENMEGYSFRASDSTIATINVNYAGVVKNGNKLTLSLFLTLTANTDLTVNSNIRLGWIYIPQIVMDKLIPYMIGTTSVVDARTLSTYGNVLNLVTTMHAYIAKDTINNRLDFHVYTGVVANGATRLLRYEVTFLLSDNLAA